MQADEPFRSGRVLLVAAHADDEVIGAGAQLPRLRDRIDILHATNGSPDNNPEYAAARRRETLAALTLAGIGSENCHELGMTDQRASFQLAELTRRITSFLLSLRPAVVLTHPYEGGHPDHDACAFAVHAAAAQAGSRPQVWEFTSYHMGPSSGMQTGEFLDNAHQPTSRFDLTMEQRSLKRRMFECFESQQQVLAEFDLAAELFRPAPHYDFTQPPHAGQLYYEQFDWGVTGSRWRQLAAEALQDPAHKSHATHRS